MKYCPYCGAHLFGGAASFCTECGKKLPCDQNLPEPKKKNVSSHSPEHKPPATGRNPLPATRNPNGSAARKRAEPKRKKRNPRSRSAERKPELEHTKKSDPRDEGYDGYYDDVLPVDNGHIRDRSNPELIKRVVLIAAGALVIVILSVVLMYFL